MTAQRRHKTLDEVFWRTVNVYLTFFVRRLFEEECVMLLCASGRKSEDIPQVMRDSIKGFGRKLAALAVHIVTCHMRNSHGGHHTGQTVAWTLSTVRKSNKVMLGQHSAPLTTVFLPSDTDSISWTMRAIEKWIMTGGSKTEGIEIPSGFLPVSWLYRALDYKFENDKHAPSAAYMHQIAIEYRQAVLRKLVGLYSGPYVGYMYDVNDRQYGNEIDAL